MRIRKSSSNDNYNEYNRYLAGVPTQQRIRLDGSIIRKGALKGGGHREVILIVSGEIVHHGIQ